MSSIESGAQADQIALLQGVPEFDSLDDRLLQKIAETAKRRFVRRGELLIEEGQPADDLYLVLKGSFAVIAKGRTIAEISKGEPIGELSFFAGGKRTASVVAARNSDVLCLSRDAYNSLASDAPELPNGILAAMSRRLARTVSASPELRPKPGKVCSVFPGGGQNIDERFIANLKQELAVHKGWGVVELDSCPLEAQSDETLLSKWLEHQEDKYENLLVICADPVAQELWAKVVASNCDTILIALEKTPTSKDGVAPSQFENELFSATMRQKIQLALYRQRKTDPTTGTAPWIDQRDVAMHHHIALDSDQDFARIGRFIRGEALGLVLCGGGSFGTAHLGAVKALLERGFTFDFVGGTSVGSAMAGALAIGNSPKDVMGFCEDIFIKSKAMSRFTIPKYSMLDHHRLDAALISHFGAYNVEDSPINFFAVATSLTENDVHVMRRGPMWKAIRSSSSIPGIFPPIVTENGEVLIDGAMMDNAPVSIMRNLKAGANLVLNFQERKPWRVKSSYEDLPSRSRVLFSLVKRSRKDKAKHPTIMSVLNRSMVVNARKLLKQTEFGQDILLNLETLRGMSHLDWSRGRELFDSAHQQMSNAMDIAAEQADLDALDQLRAAAAIINDQ